jgi:Domain of unknown function (DUF4416)
MLIVAAFSGDPKLLCWARENLHNRHGPIVLQSQPFDFAETHYYDDTMGGCLKKQFFAFERLLRPEDIADVKLETNQLERLAVTYANQIAERSGAVPKRPLNLDPGYLHSGKWVLTTTKDQAHRLYLGRGIYGEVTLRFERGEFLPWPWTYPNYRRDDYRAFFKAARFEYLRILRGLPQGSKDHSTT